MIETKQRSLLKSVTWQLTALVVLGSISYVIAGDWEQMTAITVLYTVLQVGVYFVHERIWARIPWGQIGKAEGAVTCIGIHWLSGWARVRERS